MKKLNIITIHGIRSHGDTIEKVALDTLKSLPDDEYGAGRVTPIDYPYVLALMHHIPWVRRMVEKYIAVRLHEIALLYPGYEHIVMAHSNGTRVLSQALLNAHKLCININNYKDFNLRKILLFGSIIPRKFPWHRFTDTLEVTNFVGEKDKVVLFSRGWSGRFGFKNPIVKEYRFEGGHSDYAMMMLDEIRQEVLTA